MDLVEAFRVLAQPLHGDGEARAEACGLISRTLREKTARTSLIASFKNTVSGKAESNEEGSAGREGAGLGADVDDAIQNLLMKFLEARVLGEGGTPPPTEAQVRRWLKVSLYHECVNVVREKGREVPLGPESDEDGDDPASPEPVDTAAPDPEQALIDGEGDELQRGQVTRARWLVSRAHRELEEAMEGRLRTPLQREAWGNLHRLATGELTFEALLSGAADPEARRRLRAVHDQRHSRVLAAARAWAEEQRPHLPTDEARALDHAIDCLQVSSAHGSEVSTVNRPRPMRRA
jgi:DNA-directed RNA polymerase specialized sigma24 family protein